MPARRPSGRSGRPADGWWPPASKPIAVEGGVKARSKRGQIGDTWWSRRFIAVLESFGIGSRLQRGRRYARAGQVLSLEIVPGQVRASVQGSRSKPYRVFIETEILTDSEWGSIEDVMASRAVFLAKLLSGEMPEEIEEAFVESSTTLFPDSDDDLVSACSCPDWENPCKHVAAVFYLMAEAFDDDPFLIFAWRGRDKERLLADLRARRTRSGAGESETERSGDSLETGKCRMAYVRSGTQGRHSVSRSGVILGRRRTTCRPSRSDRVWPSQPTWSFDSSTHRRSATLPASLTSSVRFTSASLPMPSRWHSVRSRRRPAREHVHQRTTSCRPPTGSGLDSPTICWWSCVARRSSSTFSVLIRGRLSRRVTKTGMRMCWSSTAASASC